MIFKTATEWVAFLADAQRQGKLDQELDRLERIPMLICDLCRYRDYADIVADAWSNVARFLRFSMVVLAGVSA